MLLQSGIRTVVPCPAWVISAAHAPRFFFFPCCRFFSFFFSFRTLSFLFTLVFFPLLFFLSSSFLFFPFLLCLCCLVLCVSLVFFFSRGFSCFVCCSFDFSFPGPFSLFCFVFSLGLSSFSSFSPSLVFGTSFFAFCCFSVPFFPWPSLPRLHFQCAGPVPLRGSLLYLRFFHLRNYLSGAPTFPLSTLSSPQGPLSLPLS